MKFIVNTTNLSSGGALQAAESLLREWQKMHLADEFHVWLSPQLSQNLRREDFNADFTFYDFARNPARRWPFMQRFRTKCRRLERAIAPDAVLTIFGPALYKPRAAMVSGFANGIFLFDDDQYVRNRYLKNTLTRWRYRIRQKLLLSALFKENQMLWVESPRAKQALQRLSGFAHKKIEVIGNACGFLPSAKTAHTRYTFIYVSAYYPHKNFEVLRNVADILKEQNLPIDILLTLPENLFAQYFQGKSNIRNLGPVPFDALADAYAQADALLMSSYLETFSASFVEAAACALPIVCADRPFAHEFCGSNALYFDPENAHDIVAKMQSLFEDDGLKSKLSAGSAELHAGAETPKSRAAKLHALMIETAKTKSN